MSRVSGLGWNRWAGIVGRALLIGALTGILGGALIYFLFGFIGFSGASLGIRLENGRDAALDPGLGKGLVAGLGIAVGLAATIVLWLIVVGRIDPKKARPWLAVLAGLIVVLSNLEALRTAVGWDGVGTITVLGIGLLVGSIVWLYAPWVLHEGG